MRLLAETGDEYDMSQVIGVAKMALDSSFTADAIQGCFRKTGCWPLQQDILSKFEADGHFKYEDLRAEEEQKQEAYEQALLEERSSLSQLAYEAKYGSEEDSVPVRRRLFSASAIDDATVEDRVDEFVKCCDLAVFSSPVASQCSSVPFPSLFMLVFCFLMFAGSCQLPNVQSQLAHLANRGLRRASSTADMRQPTAQFGFLSSNASVNSHPRLLKQRRRRSDTEKKLARRRSLLSWKSQERSRERLESLRC
jgi:hypothetical protein